LLDLPSREQPFESVPQFERFFRLLLEANHVATQKRINESLSLSAEGRYLGFIQTYPALILHIPQDQIASYLGLTAQVFSNQEWSRLHESHSHDIKVYWPDGHMTQGIDIHIEDLKALFVYAPDTRLEEHPIRFGSGKYTAVTGVFQGTFSEPMPIGNGRLLHPTGKSFRIPMATVGIWEGGVMVEEHLFWDNQTFMRQVGLAE
jgi:hypothetical protein